VAEPPLPELPVVSGNPSVSHAGGVDWQATTVKSKQAADDVRNFKRFLQQSGEPHGVMQLHWMLIASMIPANPSSRFMSQCALRDRGSSKIDSCSQNLLARERSAHGRPSLTSAQSAQPLGTLNLKRMRTSSLIKSSGMPG
jgi:hypothetical protein